MKTLSLTYKYRLPKLNKTKFPPILLLLHGYGSNESDLFSFAEDLPNDYLIISARAPLTLGFDSYAWYTINFNDQDGNYSDITEALTAKKMILNFIDELKSVFSFDATSINLLGFSQGSILSYGLALTYPKIFKNIVALSGYVKHELFEIANKEALKNLDIFMSHGIQDQVIPLIWAEKSEQFLSELNISHQFKTYHSGHGVTPQNFYDFNQWLINKLKK